MAIIQGRSGLPTVYEMYQARQAQKDNALKALQLELQKQQFEEAKRQYEQQRADTVSQRFQEQAGKEGLTFAAADNASIPDLGALENKVQLNRPNDFVGPPTAQDTYSLPSALGRAMSLGQDVGFGPDEARFLAAGGTPNQFAEQQRLRDAQQVTDLVNAINAFQKGSGNDLLGLRGPPDARLDYLKDQLYQALGGQAGDLPPSPADLETEVQQWLTLIKSAGPEAAQAAYDAAPPVSRQAFNDPRVQTALSASQGGPLNDLVSKEPGAPGIPLGLGLGNFDVAGAALQLGGLGKDTLNALATGGGRFSDITGANPVGALGQGTLDAIDRIIRNFSGTQGFGQYPDTGELVGPPEPDLQRLRRILFNR